MSTSQRKGPAIARVTFRRHQAVIEKEFQDGWSALAIYERHKADLSTISYRQFLRYVSAWRPKPEQSATTKASVESTPQPKPTARPVPAPSQDGRAQRQTADILAQLSTGRKMPDPI